MLSENKLLLLAIGINRKGKILYAEDFYEVYSNNEAAISAIQSLRGWGYIRLYSHDSCGVFQILKAPNDSYTIARHLKEEKKSLKRQKPGQGQLSDE